jgi:NADPH:quinone reductase-like Zn-dependent oxidoreductase
LFDKKEKIMSQETILVTGAVGSTARVAITILLEQGHPVRAMVRKLDARADALRELGAEVVVADKGYHSGAVLERVKSDKVRTTNSVESLNRSLRKIIKVRGGFPNEEAALKLLFLALRLAAKKWTMPIHHWREALWLTYL